MKYPMIIINVFLGFVMVISMAAITMAQDRIYLDGEKIDYFVLDPALFDPDSTGAKFFQYSPFGRKNEAVYKPGVREKDSAPVIIATSDNSISTVTTPVKADPQIFRYIEWEWKIESVLSSGDMTRRGGDDFAARVYVTFDYDPSNLSFGDRIKYRLYRTFTSFEIPLRSLNYVWGNEPDKIGSTGPNPFSDWVQYVVIQSGNEYAGNWLTEKRNLLEDYRLVYGEEPPLISGITIMTDSDNTGESTKAYFGKIILSKE
jgi:hypothetical protein